jgi:hypothetical protein
MPTRVNELDECVEFTGTDDVGSDAMPVCTNSNVQCNNNGAVNQTELSNGSIVQRNRNLISDLTLPKFTDAAKQNAVQFLLELDSYFALRRVPETLKLQIVNRAISDKYVIQWLESVRKDLRTYNDFKHAFTDLLWNSAIEAEVRNAIYLNK